MNNMLFSIAAVAAIGFCFEGLRLYDAALKSNVKPTHVAIWIGLGLIEIIAAATAG